MDIWWRALEATTGAFNVHRTLRQCCKIALDFHRQVIFSQQFSFSFHILLLTSLSNSFFLIQIPSIDITSNVCKITSEMFVFYSLHSQISLRKKWQFLTPIHPLVTHFVCIFFKFYMSYDILRTPAYPFQRYEICEWNPIIWTFILEF